MQNPNVYSIVETAIRKLGVEVADIPPSSNLIADLGIDSSELVELAAHVRSELGLHGQRVNLGKVNTVSDLVRQVEGLLHAAAPASAAQ